MTFLPQEKALIGLKKLKQIIQPYDYYCCCSGSQVSPQRGRKISLVIWNGGQSKYVNSSPNPLQLALDCGPELINAKTSDKSSVWRLFRKKFPLCFSSLLCHGQQHKDQIQVLRALAEKVEVKESSGKIERKAILEQTFILCPKDIGDTSNHSIHVQL